ncbi:MAG: glycosyltransferase [Bacteroidetes bacterium]|nr:MAG: glycosyltransferase [Bacteroidota bacterium]TAG87735.1 MAG: glycosyltransferase [Bacteroidota bacterium]
MQLDLIFPCYNPPKNWHLETYKNYQEISKSIPDVVIHLYVVDDGSKNDIEQESLDYLSKNIPHFHFLRYEKNKGKGFALRFAVEKTQSEKQIYTDIDVPFGVKSILDVYEALRNGADVVTGLRDDVYYQKVPFKRKVISQVAQTLNKLFLKLPIKDTQAGLKGFNKIGKETFLITKVNEFLFDTEFLALAHKFKHKITIIPISLKPDIILSRIKANILWRELRNFFNICYRINFKKR